MSAKKSGRNVALSVRVNHFTVVGKMVNRT
nr:MAG TPA: hypothetical protein [Caudoviricetes sp.]